MLISRSIDWLIDWLVDCSIHWLIDWLSGWLIDWAVDWLIDWFTERSIDWLIDWLILRFQSFFRVGYRNRLWISPWPRSCWILLKVSKRNTIHLLPWSRRTPLIYQTKSQCNDKVNWANVTRMSTTHSCYSAVSELFFFFIHWFFLTSPFLLISHPHHDFCSFLSFYTQWKWEK